MFLAWGCFYCREVRPVIRVPTCTRSHFPLTWPVHKERFAHFLLFLPPNRFYTLYDVKLHIARNLMETRENMEIESHPFYHIVCDWFSCLSRIFFILMQLGKSTMESTCTNLFYAHGALTDKGVSGAAICSGGAAQLRFRVDPESFPCVIRGGILQ